MAQKPKLPSIQWMLNDLPSSYGLDAPVQAFYPHAHQRHGSDHDSIPGTVATGRQQLGPYVDHSGWNTCSRPPPIEPSLADQPFYRMPSSFLPPHRTPRHQHARSNSDYTGQRPTFLSPPSSEAHQQPTPMIHRRAISTNTIELMLQPRAPHFASPSTPRSTTIPSTPSMALATSVHRPVPHSSSSTSTSDDDESDLSSESLKTADNKYHCGYCDKGFSRPSSLRIHIYSHTGEKPFECPEEGCCRKFSVQSNMRRHLRVHRLGRVLKRQPSKTLAAKPTWVNVMP